MKNDTNPCKCKGCQEEKGALQRQLDHPFYRKVDDFRDEIKLETLKKAAKKYIEPFNPASWTIRQLGEHAMSENYDQGNYIVGLMDAAETLEKEVDKFKNRCKNYEEKLNRLQEENEKIKYTIAENCQLRKEKEELKAQISALKLLVEFQQRRYH